MSDISSQVRAHVERARLAIDPSTRHDSARRVGTHDALGYVAHAVEELLSALEACARHDADQATGRRTSAALARLADLGVRLPPKTRSMLEALR